MANNPTTFGRYQVVSQIGHGGMGALYLAWDPNLERHVAIKVLIKDNEELRERFSREVRSAARLRHPHIVTMYDVGEYDGQPFMAMEYVEGHTLAEIIRKREPLSTLRKLQLAMELADGLAYAHKAGVIHRDVKPANVMVDVHGAVKILDFGIARLIESVGMTQAGIPLGTLNYMSPEQLAGRKVDQRSDIFSYGALVYELFSYHQAFPGGVGTGLLDRLLRSDRRPLAVVSPTLDPEIIRVIDRALEVDVQRRYPDLDSIGRDLEPIRLRLIATGEPTHVITPSSPETTAYLEGMVPPAPADPKPSPLPRAQTPRRAIDLEELSRRRAARIAEYLQGAHEAFAAGDLDEGIAMCEKVLMLDAEEPTANALLERARTALDERQAEEWLAEAEREIRRGALTAALAKIEQAEAIVPGSTKAAQLRTLAEEAVRERDRARQRADAIRQALARGHAHFDQGRFQEAASAADETLALGAGLAEAVALKAQSLEALDAEAREARARRAREAVREARRLFSADQHAAAVNLLATFEPKEPLISQTLEQLQAEMNRLAEQRRVEAERRAKQQRIRNELQAAQQDIDTHGFAQAINRLNALTEAEGSTPEIARLLEAATAAQAEAERQARIASQVAGHLATAAALRSKDDLAGAKISVDAALSLAPGHAAALVLDAQLREDVRIAGQRREAEDRQRRERAEAIAAGVARAGRAGSHEAAIAVLNETLAIDPDAAEVQKLLAQHREALAREEAERRRVDAENRAKQERVEVELAAARREIDGQEFEQAIERLHGLASAEGATPEIDALIARAKAAQAEIERAEDIAREIAEHVARAAGLFARNDLTGALSRVDAALALDPGHGAALNLRGKIQQGMRAATERREAEERRAREQADAIAAAIAKADRASSHEEAIDALDEALSIDPDHVEVRRRLTQHRDAIVEEQAEQGRRLEADRVRREQIHDQLEVARQAVGLNDLDTARLAVARIRDLDPGHLEADALADDIEEAARFAQGSTVDDADVPAPPPAPSIAPASSIAPAPSIASASAPAMPVRNATVVAAPESAPGKAAGKIADKSIGKTAGNAPAKRRSLYTLVGLGLSALAIVAVSYLTIGRRPAPVASPTGDQTDAGIRARSSESKPGAVAAPATVSTVPPAAAATSPPAATPPPATRLPPATSEAAGPNVSVEQRLTALRQLVRRQYAAGERQQALASATTGLSLRAEDRDLRNFLLQALRDARAETAAARAQATASGASAAAASPTYQDGEQRAREAARLAATAPSPEAIRAYWIATDLFTKAATEGRIAALRPATTVPPAAPTSPSPAPARPSQSSPLPPTPAPPDARPAAERQPPVQPPTVSPATTTVPAPTPAAPPAPAPTTAPPLVQTPSSPAVQPPTTVAPPARAPVSEEPAIRAVLRTYADGYSTLDVRAVQRAFPGVNAASLQRTFSQTKSQTVKIIGEQIQVNGTTATVTCIWQMIFEGQVGGVQRASPRVLLTLQKTAGGWIIIDRR